MPTWLTIGLIATTGAGLGIAAWHGWKARRR